MKLDFRIVSISDVYSMKRMTFVIKLALVLLITGKATATYLGRVVTEESTVFRETELQF